MCDTHNGNKKCIYFDKKSLLARPSHRWEVILKIYFWEINYTMEWTEVARYRVWCQIFVVMVMNFKVL